MLLIILFVPLIVFAARPSKTVELEVCNSKFCYSTIINKVIKSEKVFDMKDREYIRFFQDDGRITDVYVDGMTVKYLRGK